MKHLQGYTEERPYFKLFACCILVKGHTRSIVADLQRNNLDFIPNGFYTILTEFKDKPFHEVSASFDEADHETITEYFNFLIEKEYMFWISESELALFPDINEHFETPSIIENAIIDVNKQSNHNWSQLIKQLLDLGCRALQVRFFSPVSYDSLNSISELVKRTSIKSFEIVLPYDPSEFAIESVNELLASNLHITSFTFYDAPVSETVSSFDNLSRIYYINEKITGAHHCGFVHSTYFAINPTLYFESLKHNNCLNKKISVDENGHIKNCPAMKTNYGHTSTTSFRTALADSSFKELWDINKDKIEGCKDCEFRYVCTDCRAHITDEKDIYSKPMHCKYDPYIGEWLE